MTLDVSSLQSSMAGNLIQSVLGQSQQAQTELAMKLARLSLATNVQSTTTINGAGSLVDVVG